MKTRIAISVLVLLAATMLLSSQEVIIARRRAATGSCSKSVSVPNKGGGNHNTQTHNEFTMTVANNSDLVVVGIWCATTCSITSVVDDLANAFTATTSSPGSDSGGSGTPYIYYRLTNTAGSRTITVNTSASQESQIGGLDVALGTGCVAVFDTDAAATTATGTAIVTPLITGAAAGEFLYGFAATSHSISSANSPWTQGTIFTGTSNADEYILSSSGIATAVNFTQASGGASAMAAAFKVQ